MDLVKPPENVSRLSVRFTHTWHVAVPQVDNVEDRQSRIEQEQREGGKGTAYAIAVSHMLKKDPPAPANASSVAGDGGASGADNRNKESTLRKLGSSSAGSASTPGGSKAAADSTPSRVGGLPDAQTGAQEGARNGVEGVQGAVVGVRFSGVEEEQEERHEEGGSGTVREALVVDLDREVGGTDGDGGGDGQSDLDSDSESGDGSDFSGSEDEEEDGGGHTRRNWAERRARLRKDGMHGRRLPPPQAEEERASAKAEKREVSPWR